MTSAEMRRDPHPLTGQPFESPVPAGTGWPGDRATGDTPVAGTPAAVRRLARSAGTIDELDARISVCRACPRLVAWREEVATTGRRRSFAQEPYWGRPVPAFGDVDATRLIVGLAPAANGANRTGRMFTGDRSGDWLFAALHRAGFANQPSSMSAGDGLQLRGIRITAPVRCAPPANKPTTAEKATCAPWLERELQLSADTLRVILTLGGIGWDTTISTARTLGWEVPRPKPKFGHGARATLLTPNGPVELVGCYHVSQQNTFTGRLTESMLDDVLALVRELG
ncbi:uracil-DNA glycosylase [Flexivirga oryzae]|uniref:Type-5 uracil-DNA glycosylase n=1 Tax=Flexivirga oryzae TaxID=1794944 RepID=A0A839N773_9MICO|nr:uracil-DNA glycosylase [Flexivirga oryzae]MBB2891486.1 uracil-DNA glycosylase family 4 [Flexivirga oryzae]